MLVRLSIEFFGLPLSTLKMRRPFSSFHYFIFICPSSSIFHYTFKNIHKRPIFHGGWRIFVVYGVTDKTTCVCAFEHTYSYSSTYLLNFTQFLQAQFHTRRHYFTLAQHSYFHSFVISPFPFTRS